MVSFHSVEISGPCMNFIPAHYIILSASFIIVYFAIVHILCWISSGSTKITKVEISMQAKKDAGEFDVKKTCASIKA